MKKDPRMRKLKVESQILREVSDIIFSEVNDPRVEGAVISRVVISDDMRRATVYLVPKEGVAQQIEGLKSAQGFVRFLLKKRLCMRVIPVVSFEVDSEYEGL